MLNTPDAHQHASCMKMKVHLHLQEVGPGSVVCVSCQILHSGKKSPSVVSVLGSKGLVFHFSLSVAVISRVLATDGFIPFFEMFLLSLPCCSLKDLLSF